MRACPKCKGGCDLCRGSGQVTETVAEIFIREESRRTERLGPDDRRKLLREASRFASEPPSLIRRASRQKWIALFVVLAVGCGIAIGFAIRVG